MQCGIRIENATMSEAGAWRLTAKNAQNMSRGISWVDVRSESHHRSFQTQLIANNIQFVIPQKC